jgi:predicted CopG family antitoxin
MAVKTITITEDAYTRLAALKAGNESFSDVIRKVVGKSSLLDLVGALKKENTAALRKAVRDVRADVDRRVERTARRLA